MNVRKVVIGVVVALVVLFALALFVGAMMWGRAPYGAMMWGRGYGMGPGMMRGFGYPYGMHMFGGGILMVLFGLLILGGLALLVAYLVRRAGPSVSQGMPARQDETPLDILKRRYASGEIDREQYEQMKESLS